jgi:uncharacterized membrane protein
MTTFISGLFLFIGAHSISVVSPRSRDRVVEKIGLQAYRGIYALVTLAGLVLIVIGYGDLRGQTPILYVTPRWVHGISATLMIPVFPLLLAAYFPGVIKTVARHPTLVAVKLWAFAHLLANGSLADVALFGSFLAWAVAVRISLKRRPARKIAEAPPGRWNDVIVIVAGAAVYAFMFHAGHAWLIGMPLVLL